MPSIYALTRKHKKLQEEYDLKGEELRRLRKAHTIETDPSQKFKFEKQIEQLEEKRKQLEQELEKSEHQIEVILSGVEGPPFQWDYSKFPINFSSKVDFLTQYFVGRQEAIEKIDQFLQDHKSGYLATVGEAGIGKSALLAHEVKKRGTVHHFVDDKQNSAKDEVFLRCIVEQLRQKYGFEFDERTPISVSEWNIYFQKWMKEISTEEKLVICVDALDEAQHYGGSDSLLKYLPQELPENVYFILTSRPEFKKEDITFLDSTVFERYNLPSLTQADIEAYLTQRFPPFLKGGQGGFSDVPSFSKGGPGGIFGRFSEIAAILHKKSEGNPLYLYYLLQECDGANLTLEQVNQLPQGLTKFYEKQWNERIWTGDKATKEGRKQILCLLLILKEPPSEEMLLELTDFDRAELLEYLTPLRRFMHIGEWYELFHDSFKSFVTHQFEKTIPVYQEKLIEYLWDWRELKEEIFQYALSWLPSYLAEASDTEKLKILLEDLSFVETKINEHSVPAIQHDFVLLKKKDKPLVCLEKSLFRQTHIISQYPESCVIYLYNYLWGAYPKHTGTWSTWFNILFKTSSYLPKIYLKRLNHCPGRIDEALIFTFKGHSDSVTSVAFSPNGQQIISGSKDRTLKLWDVSTGKLVKTFEGHAQGVNSIAFSPDGRYVISGSEDQMLKLWDVNTGRLIKTFEGHTSGVNAVAYSPDGQFVISGSNDKTIKLWNVPTGQTIKTFEKHTFEVTAVAYSPDGQYVISGYKDRLLKFWNVRTGENIKTFERYVGEVNTVMFSPDNRNIICGSFEGMLTLWYIDNPEHAIRNFQDTAFAGSVTFSPDGHQIISGSFNGTLVLSDVDTGDSLRTFEGHSGKLWTVAFSPNGQQIISGSDDRTIKLWNLDEEQTMLRPQKYSFEETLLAEFSSSGQFLFSVNEDKTITLWNVNTGQAINTFAGHTLWIRAMAFFSNEQIMVSGSDDGRVNLWNIHTKQKVETFELYPPLRITALAVSPDNQHIILGSQDGILILCNFTKKQVIRVFKGHTNRVRAIALSMNGQHIISSSDDLTLKLWHINEEQAIRTFSEHTEQIWSIAFSPSGQHIVLGSLDKTLKPWHIDTERAIKTFEGHSSGVVSVAFSKNDQYIASGSTDHTLKLWNFETGKNILTFVGEAPIICVHFSPDGHEIWAADNYYLPRIYRFEIVIRDT